MCKKKKKNPGVPQTKEQTSLGGCLSYHGLKVPTGYPNREMEVKGTPGVEHRGQPPAGVQTGGQGSAGALRRQPRLTLLYCRACQSGR